MGGTTAAACRLCSLSGPLVRLQALVPQYLGSGDIWRPAQSLDAKASEHPALRHPLATMHCRPHACAPPPEARSGFRSCSPGCLLPAHLLSGASRLQALLEEYLGSGDTAEAARCLHDLTVPLYHHELVKRALLMALDPTGHHAASLFGLLAKLAASGEVNQVCARAGCCHTGFCCSLVAAEKLSRAGPDCCLWKAPPIGHTACAAQEGGCGPSVLWSA